MQLEDTNPKTHEAGWKWVVDIGLQLGLPEIETQGRQTSHGQQNDAPHNLFGDERRYSKGQRDSNLHLDGDPDLQVIKHCAYSNL